MKRQQLPVGILMLLWAMVAWASTAPLGLTDALPNRAHVEVQYFGALDLDLLAEEDAINQALGQPARFAVPHPADVGASRGGTWDTVGDTSVWRFRVQAEEAASFNFGFSRFRLPEGAALYIYSADGRVVAGPYTAAQNAKHGEFWTPIIPGSDVLVELNVPTALRDQVQLELGSINQGYRGFGTALQGYRQPDIDLDTGAKSAPCKSGDGEGDLLSGSCNTDVICLDDDDPWNNERRSSGAYSRNGTLACSGSLVNNTANDRRMLFITATHCGVTSGNASTVVVFWNYEWPTCRRPGAAGGTATNPPDPNMSSSGATFLAATTNPFSGGGCTVPGNCSDVTLLEMNTPADPAMNHFWAGWDRSDPAFHACPGSADPNATDGMCAGIHHPAVHEKRITFSETNLVTGNIASAQGVHWRVDWDLTPPELPNFPPGGALPVSVTEPGSSGSPLYNADRRLVGVLSGGLAACGAPNSSQFDLYGKIAHAWNGLGTPTTRIRDYLDPLALNPMTLDGVGMAPFRLSADPSSLALCGTDGSVDVSIEVDPDPGFVDPVDLAGSGEPPGSSLLFAPTAVTPPGSSTLTLGNLGVATPGDYILQVTGSSGGDESSTSIAISLSGDTLAPTTLLEPADAAPEVVAQPTLSWSANGDAIDYTVEVASDDQFNDIVFTDTLTATEVVVDPPLAILQTYFWRVTARNNCGDGAVSEVRSFFVPPPIEVFADGFESPVDPDIVFSGPINHSLMADTNGTSINWISGDIVDDDPNSGYDINLYATGGALAIWWSFSPSASAGVAPTSGTANLSVLGSGAEVGPGSTFSRTNGAMTDWRAGANGYLGFRFDCSSLPTAPVDGICYGYMRMQTTAGTGYPATVVEYAYNRAGNPITVP